MALTARDILEAVDTVQEPGFESKCPCSRALNIYCLLEKKGGHSSGREKGKELSRWRVQPWRRPQGGKGLAHVRDRKDRVGSIAEGPKVRLAWMARVLGSRQGHVP